jgi:3'-5' exonuclease
VMNTYLLYCRFQKMRGGLTAAEYDQEITLVKQSLDQLAGMGETHWQEYLAAWD